MNDYASQFDDLNRLPDDLWNLAEPEYHYDVSVMPDFISCRPLGSKRIATPAAPAPPPPAPPAPAPRIHGPNGFLPHMRPVICDHPMKYFYDTRPSTVMMHTPPNSPPTLVVKSENDDLNSILESFPEILETSPPGGAMDFGSILSDLHASLPFDEIETLPHDSPEVPSPMSPNDSPFKLGIPKDGCVKKDIMLSWGSGDYINKSKCSSAVKKIPVKVRNASGNSDSGISPRSAAKPSPIRYTDEQYEHLPETPCMSDVDADETDINETTEKYYNARFMSSFVNSSVKSEHNYCGKNPLLNASTDTPSASDTDDDADIKVVKIGKPAQHLSKMPFRIVYNQQTAKVAQKPSKVVFKPLSKITGIGLSPHNIPTTNSAEVKQQLLKTIQESMKNKYSRKIMRVPNVDQSRPQFTNVPESQAISLSSNAKRIPTDALQSAAKTLGKPDAYTKRIRDEHCETVKKTAKRRKLADDPEDNIDRRKEHNNLERIRRVNLKNLFDKLKILVPRLDGDRKTSKVTILSGARDYIRCLQGDDDVIEDNSRLNQRLRELQRGLSFQNRSVHLTS